MNVDSEGEEDGLVSVARLKHPGAPPAVQGRVRCFLVTPLLLAIPLSMVSLAPTAAPQVGLVVQQVAPPAAPVAQLPAGLDTQQVAPRAEPAERSPAGLDAQQVAPTAAPVAQSPSGLDTQQVAPTAAPSARPQLCNQTVRIQWPHGWFDPVKHQNFSGCS